MKKLLPLIVCLPLSASALEINGNLGISSLIYQHAPQYSEQHRSQTSAFAELDLYHSWNDERDSLRFKPYVRLDQHDSARTHADIRELLWIHVADDWELRTGIGKVFWGVNEANHLVDIINQDDLVDDMSDDPKLGQPMINLSLVRDWGTVDLFVLPGFRERTYAGEQGRLRPNPAIDTDNASFESHAKEKHVDFALRWSHSFDEYDLGLSYFNGTGRDPRLQQKNGKLIPHYEQIQQLGFDAQATLDEWLWKFEAIYRKDAQESFAAASGGFEYTFVGLFDSSADLGWLMEYSWDDRGTAQQQNIFQNDVMIGWRLAMNDAESSELLLGMVQDLDDTDSRSLQLEASRRFGDNIKLNLEWRWFSDSPSQLLAEDDHVQLSLTYYY